MASIQYGVTGSQTVYMLNQTPASYSVASGGSPWYPVATGGSFAANAMVANYANWVQVQVGAITSTPSIVTYNGTPTYWHSWNVYHGPQETPEERTARELTRELNKKANEAAASRADQLLLSLLSDDQADQYKRDNHFDLRIGGRQYRIRRGRAGNVLLIENGKPVAKYCAHPTEWTPDGDAMIAQMLMLQTDEDGFLKIANRTSLA